MAEQPGGAQNHIFRARSRHRLLAGQLAAAVLVDGIGWVLGPVSLGPAAVKHVVGGEVDQGQAAPGAGPGQVSGTLGINAKGRLGAAFGLVHRGIGRGVNHQGAAGLVQGALYLPGPGEVGILAPMAQQNHPRRGRRLQQRPAHLTVAAQNQNRHRANHKLFTVRPST